MISRRNFNISTLGLLPVGGFLIATSGCGSLSSYIQYFDLAVSALDTALPTILGVTSGPILTWANLIAQALTAAGNILESATLSTASKVVQIAQAFDNIVIPSVTGLTANVQNVIKNVIQGVYQFLAALGIVSTASPTAANELKSHTVAPTVPTVLLKLTSTDTKTINKDLATLVGIISSTSK